MPGTFGVIFDMDGVIIDSNPFHKISLRQFVARYGHTLSEEELRERVYGRTNRQWLTNLFGPLPEEQLRRYADEKESLFRSIYKDDIKPVEGLVKFLDLLEAHHIPHAIATSAPPENVDFTMEGTGIRKYFQTILDDTFVTNGKPNPEIYLKASAALEMSPAHCIVIEDSLSGIQAGKAAGCRVIGITTTHTPEEMHEADYTIDTFHDLSVEKLAALVRA